MPIDKKRLEVLSTLRETQDLLQFFQDEFQHDHKIKVAGIDIDGILRGKIISKAKFMSSLKSGGFGFCSVVFGWDMHDRTYDTSTSTEGSFEVYGDVLACIDLQSYRRIPWELDLPFFLVDFKDVKTMKALPICPRGLLKAINDRYMAKDQIPTAGVEFEFFNFEETPESMRHKKFMDLKPLTPGMFGYSLLRPTMANDYFDAIYDQCLKFGIEIEGLHTETGPGVYETALKYGEAVALADNGQLLKTSVKQLGMLRPAINGRPAIYPSFMAKPSTNLPGCSGHVHLSLMSKTKDGSVVNLFHDDADEWNMSALMKHFIAGLLTGLPELMPIYAPTVNSYKRLVENYWAPVRVCWGLENRTAALRVITPKTSGEAACSKSGTRVEMRVPGADINTHLVLAACFASGMYGIDKKLELCPPVSYEGKMSAERLSLNLGDATRRMKASHVAREILGDAFVDHFTRTRLEEWNKWEREVTQYEVARYFELV
eukprot:Partr_v1_DN25284_c0_g1_i1_m16993 putative glutamine synthetase